MAYRRIFIWVEGGDDVRFFEQIIKPRLSLKYDNVEIRPYCGMKKDKLCAFVRSIRCMGADYLVIGDIDTAPCISQAKTRILDRCGANEKNIIVVSSEIESWYLAGMDQSSCRKYGVAEDGPTDAVAKEEFEMMMPNTFASRVDWMTEILKNYSIGAAARRNTSFRYFAAKLELPLLQ